MRIMKIDFVVINTENTNEMKIHNKLKPKSCISDMACTFNCTHTHIAWRNGEQRFNASAAATTTNKLK